jgi:hypothetical protein
MEGALWTLIHSRSPPADSSSALRSAPPHRPPPPSTGLNDLKPFNLSTVLMAVHKHCYTSLTLT